MKVGIIGAGIAGLCTAKIFKSFGLEVTILEKEPDVGGVWASSRRYPGLTTQNPRETYEFSDFPMPRDYPEWPTGQQVQAYLERYVSHFDLADHLKLSTEVISAVPLTQATGWQIVAEQRNKEGLRQKAQFTFDFLVVCNGIFSIPVIPEFPGAPEFLAHGGKIMHTSTFTELEDVRNRNVIVVGYGKSSCDAANATVGVSQRTTLVARNLIWKIPKKLKNVLNFKYLFLTRMGEGLFPYIRLRGFEKFLHGPGLPVRNSMLKTVENVVAKQLRLQEIGLLPDKPLETIARSTVSLVTDGFYENILADRLDIRQGVEIQQLKAGEAILTNGVTIPVDTVVCGTGWDQRVAFFDAELIERITDKDGNFRLYQTMVPVDVPGLVFNGYNSSFFSQLNAEVGALWLVEYLAGMVALPERSEMNRLIDERLKWTGERTDGKHSKGTNIIPFSVHQMDELLNEINLNLGVFKRFVQWLKPITGSDYRPLTEKLRKRHQVLNISIQNDLAK